MKREGITEKLPKLAINCYGYSETIEEDYEKGSLNQFRDNPTQRLDNTIREMEDLIKKNLKDEIFEFYMDQVRYYGSIVDREFTREFSYDLK